MEQNVSQWMSPQVQSQACAFFGIEVRSLALMGDMENYVYQGVSQQGRRVLRLTHSSHRAEDEILAEMEFIDYLHRSGCDVAFPILSQNYSLVENIELPDGTQFFVCCFEHATGRLTDPANPNDFNPTLYRVWGYAIGQMHYYSRQMPRARHQRRAWHESEYLNLDRYMPLQEDRLLREAAEPLLKNLKSRFHHCDWGREIGLIHADLHQGNFFLHERGITAFDFDDSQVDWFANDIAVILYSVIGTVGRLDETRDLNAYGRDFYRYFLEGYRCFCEPEDQWVELIPQLLRVREMVLWGL
ncbi:MAG: phosphotransferase [Candidatus Cloacimonetes bacterium]|nr:phosphotransferase [Candidatus Cloacimonadota bacterium]